MKPASTGVPFVILLLLSAQSLVNCSSSTHDLVRNLAEAITSTYVTESSTGSSGSSERHNLHSLQELGETISQTLNNVAEEMLVNIRKAQGLDDEADIETTTADTERSRRHSFLHELEDKDEGNDMQGDQPLSQRRSKGIKPRPVVNHVAVQRLKGIEPLFSICDGAHHVSTTMTANGVFAAVCISSGGRPITIGEISFSDKAFRLRETIPDLKDPKMASIFEHDNKLHLVIADSGLEETRVYKMEEGTLKINENEKRGQGYSIPTRYPTAVIVWQLNSEYHLAASESAPFKRQELKSMRNQTNFYSWKDSYFDGYASVESFHVKDICPFSVGGKDYIVIINHESSPGVFRVDSEIFRYDANFRQWISVQKIKTRGAVDCEIFSMGVAPRAEIFLAVANSIDRPKNGGEFKYDVESVIYKFSNERFVPFQCIKTVGATQIKAVDANQPEGVFALAVAHSYGVQMFQYNGWRFVPTLVQYTQGSMGTGVKSLTFMKTASLPVLVVANPLKMREKNVIQFTFEPNNILSDWKKKSLDWCRKTRSVDVQKGLRNLEKSLKEDVFLVDQKDPIRIKGDLTFNSPMVEVHGILSAPSIFNVDDKRTFDHKTAFELQEVDKLLREVEAQAKKTQDILSRALRLDATHQVITGHYTFNNDLVLKCGSGVGSLDSCNFREIKTNTLNGDDVTNLVNEVIRIDRDHVITRNDLLFKHVEVAGNLRVPDGLINGVNMSQVVTKSGTHFIEAPTTMKGGVSTNAISVSGLINSAKIDSNHILLKSGNQEIRSQIIFNDVTANNLNVSVVNSVPFNNLLSKIITTDGNHVISGRKDFRNKFEIQSNLDLAPKAKISGVDIINLWHNVLWTHGDQDVRAPSVMFSNVKIAGDLKVESGIINGERVPGPNMILNTPSQTPIVVKSPKNFMAPMVKVDRMHIKKSINGIRSLESVEGLRPLASEWPDQLDLLTKTKAQTIPAHKSFRSSIHLGGHSTLEGTVSDIDLSQLEQIVLKHNETNELAGTWTVDGSAVFNERLTVMGEVDGVNLTHLYTQSMKLSDTVISAFPSFNFAHIVADRVEASFVNDLDIKKDLMTKTTQQTISGAKIFPQGLLITTDFTLTESLNGIDASFMNDSLMKSVDQTIFGPKTVNGDIYVKNLVTQSLNGINMNDLIFINTDQPQVISGSKIFRNIRVSDSSINASNIEVSSDINGVKIRELFDNTMLYDAPQEVTGVKHFDQIEIPLGSNLHAESVNGYKLRDIISDAVYVDGDQDIQGDKIFNSQNVRFKELNFRKTFDGVTEDTIKKNWLFQGEDQEIHGDLIFKDTRTSGSRRSPLVVVAGNLYVENGTLNGHHIQHLDRSIVKKNQPAVIEGVITFKGVVTSEGDVDVSGKIQGVKLSTDALLKNHTSGVVPIFGKKTFKKNVIVHKNLQINGHVDGVLIDELCKTAVRVFGDQVITAPVTVKGTLSSASFLSSDGLIDGVDVRQLEKACLLRNSNRRQVLQGKKHFRSLVLMAPSEVGGKFGGINLKDFEKNYMSLTKNQVVETPIIFSDGVTFEADTFVDGNIETRDKIIRSSRSNTAIDLKFIDDKSLKIYGNQVVTGPLVFKNEVFFSKNVEVVNMKVDGIPFDWMMLKNRPHQEVKGPVTFESDINVQGDIDMNEGASVAGVDMSRIRRSMVNGQGIQETIIGKKNFSKIAVDHLVVKGLLNGIHFSPANILLSSHNVSQIIHGKTTFNKDVIVSGSLKTRTINGVNLHEVRNNLVLNGMPGGNTISAPKTIEGPVQAADTWTINLIDGVNVTHVKENVYDMKFRRELESISNRLGFQQKKLAKLERVLENQVDCVDHYRSLYSVNGSILPSNDQRLVFMSSMGADGCSVIDVHILTPGKRPLLITRIEGVFYPKKVFVIQEKLLIVSHRGMSEAVFKTCLPSRIHGEVSRATNKALVQVVSLPSALMQMMSTNRTTSLYVSYVSHVIPLGVTSIVTDAIVIPSSSSTVIQTCLAVSGSPKLQVLCSSLNGVSTAFENEVSSVRGVVTAMSSVFIEEERNVIIALTYFSHIEFFSWNPSQRSLESSFLQKIIIQVPDPKTLPVTHMTPRSLSGLFFIVSEKRSRRIRDRSPLTRIFQHQTNGVSAPFLENQQISETNDILSIESLVSSTGDLSLFFLTDDQRVKIFRMKGSSGFMLTDTIEGQALFSSSSIGSFSVMPLLADYPVDASSSKISSGHFVVVSKDPEEDRESLLVSSSISKQAEPETQVLFSVVQNRFIPGLN